MEQLKIEYLPVDDLREYKHNAKLHPEEQIQQIANSIEKFGMNDPIAVDEEHIIIEGHGRLLAVKKLIKDGLYDSDTVPVIILSHMTDQQKKAYILAHNKLTLNSGFDIDILNDELASISEFDMSAFGFEDEIGKEEKDPEDDNYEEPVPAVAKSKLGQIYALGEHRLMVGDSTNPEDVQRLMAGEFADLVVTDPPYNVGLGQENGHKIRPSEAKQLHRRTDGLVIENDDWADENEFVQFLNKAFTNLKAALKPGGPFYIWCASTQSMNFLRACAESGLTIRQTLIWVKNTFALGRQDYQWNHEPCLYGWKEGAGHYFTDKRNEITVYENAMDIHKMSKAEMEQLLLRIYDEEINPTTILHEKKPVASDLHPTMKPIPLFGRLIKNSTKPGETVLDLFAGSGTTAIAAEQLGRRAFLMEYDPRYADTIIDRWEKYTGEKAVLLNV